MRFANMEFAIDRATKSEPQRMLNIPDNCKATFHSVLLSTPSRIEITWFTTTGTAPGMNFASRSKVMWMVVTTRMCRSSSLEMARNCPGLLHTNSGWEPEVMIRHRVASSLPRSDETTNRMIANRNLSSKNRLMTIFRSKIKWLLALDRMFNLSVCYWVNESVWLSRSACVCMRTSKSIVDNNGSEKCGFPIEHLWRQQIPHTISKWKW